MNEERALFPSDEQIRQWAKTSVSSNMEDTIHPAEQSATMQAAANREQFS